MGRRVARGMRKVACVRVGQGMRGWATPPHPRIYRVPTHPHPPGLQAFPSFLPHPFPPSFSCDIFRAVFDSRSSFFAHRPHRNPCYASYEKRKEKNLLLPQSAQQLFPISFQPNVSSIRYAQEGSENIKGVGARGRGDRKGFGLFGLFLPTPVHQNVLAG